MAICGGDVLQYHALKRGTVDDYCIKLETYVDTIATPKEKEMQNLIKGGNNRTKK